jgi:hypothetical protein
MAVHVGAAERCGELEERAAREVARMIAVVWLAHVALSSHRPPHSSRSVLSDQAVGALELAISAAR